MTDSTLYIGGIGSTYTQPPVHIALDTRHGPLVVLTVGRDARELLPGEVITLRNTLNEAYEQLEMKLGAEYIARLAGKDAPDGQLDPRPYEIDDQPDVVYDCTNSPGYDPDDNIGD